MSSKTLLFFLLYFSSSLVFGQFAEDGCSATANNEITLSSACASPVSFTISNSYSNSASTSCGVTTDNDGWFWFTGNGAAVTVTCNMNKDFAIEIFASCGGTSIDCATALANNDASISLYPAVGHVYYILVDRLTGGGGNMNGTLCVNGFGVTTVEPGPAGHSAQTPVPIAWYKSDNGVTGSPSVSNWADQSPYSNDVSQGTSNYMPTIINSDPLYNFHAALYSDGDDFLSIPYLLDINSNASVYFVGRPENLTGRKTGVGFGDIYDTNDGDDPRVGINDQYFAVHHDQSFSGLPDSVYFWTTPVTTDQNYVLGTRWQTSTSSGWVDTRVNSWYTVNNSLLIYSGTVGEEFSIFGSSDPSTENDNWLGTINEVVIYDYTLSTGPALRVDSYLAIKYGITLGQNGTGGIYFSSYGGAYWDPGLNPGYNYDIAGIVKDDVTSLDQKKSHSSNSSGTDFSDILTIANGTNFSAPSDFLLSRCGLMWGHNGGILANTGSVVNYITDNSELIETIFSRQWKAQETSLIETVTLEFDLNNVAGFNGIDGNNDLANVRLLVDEDGDFSDGNATSISPSSYDNSTNLVYFQHEFNPDSGIGSDQLNGYFFTLGSVNATLTPLADIGATFDYECSEDGIEFTWTSFREEQLSHYVLLISEDGQHFEEIKQITATGTTSESSEYKVLLPGGYDPKFVKLLSYTINNIAAELGEYHINCPHPIKIYPNPTNSILYIKTDIKRSVEVQILGMTGNAILDKSFTENETPTIDVSNLATGCYQILITQEGKRYLEKFTKL